MIRSVSYFYNKDKLDKLTNLLNNVTIILPVSWVAKLLVNI
jgi:hypothetical protein